MKLVLYNTLTRKKEIFNPLHKSWVGLYTCGPTVYNYVHIGNLRTYIFQDILKKTLEYDGYRVRHIMNLTDVDDKTIRASRAAGKTLKAFTRRYEKFFKEDLKKLDIAYPEKFTRATEHIPAMVKIIAALLKRGFAYKKAGSVYFDISRFRPYGRLAHLDLKGLKAGARVDVDEYTKKEAQDFVLWKTRKLGEPYWDSPFGKGRPGWHIECSAMSTQYLGQPFDIHTGAVDLIFPHHENEIAQSEGVGGRKFVRYWVHGEHLLVNGKKMSKSLGNIFTLRDVVAKNFSPLAFRYLILTAHYRSKINFTWGSLLAAQSSLERIYDFVQKTRLFEHRGRGSLKKYESGFNEAIFDDLDTPRALALIWDLIWTYNKYSGHFDSKRVLSLLYKFDRVLSLNFAGAARSPKIQYKIIKLLQNREKYRKMGEWQQADKIRNEVKKLGYIIEDTTGGPKLKQIK